MRWYNSFTEKLGDGARVNIIVKNDDDANSIFDKINEDNPIANNDRDLRRINEKTDLGYPKRLIEVRTPSGIISEIQVITDKAYLAKDGISGFTGDQEQKDSAKKELKNIREKLGWNIPDGLGHYFYEIERDTNVPDELRDEAKRLLDNLHFFSRRHSHIPVEFDSRPFMLFFNVRLLSINSATRFLSSAFSFLI